MPSEKTEALGRLLVTGDLHGDTAALVMVARKMLEGDVLFAAGDFGYIFRDSNDERCFLNDVDQFLRRKSSYLIFVDGNHENHRVLNKFPVEDWMGAKVHFIRSRIIHVLRGEVLEIKGKRIFCFGGAFSIDRSYRELNVSYWEEELPTDGEFRNGNANLEACGYRVDFVVTHTCPVKMLPYLGARHAAAEEYPLQNYLQYVNDRVVHSLRQWYFGHWHMDRELPQKCRAVYLDVVDMESGRAVF